MIIAAHVIAGMPQLLRQCRMSEQVSDIKRGSLTSYLG
jgi:hypothetical protein